MKAVIAVIIILAIGALLFIYTRPNINMELTSLSFDNNGQIPSRLSCDGGNLSPQLKISGVPATAKSLALVVDDPDASRGVTFTHWIIWNIPTGTTEVLEGRPPTGAVQGKNDFGNFNFDGPCPPSGASHHYRFKLYALDSNLSLLSDSTARDLEPEIEKHLIIKTELIGLYTKP